MTLNNLYTKFDGDDIENAYIASYKTCLKKVCSPKDLAKKDARALAYSAQQQEIKINIVECPGTTKPVRVDDGTGKTIEINNKRRCFIASWGDTEPTTSGANHCVSTTGNYELGANCFVMET